MLKINEIFNSIDGEINQWHQGATTTFIRFSQCNISCNWCDTHHKTYQEYKVNELIKKIQGTAFNKITITGGEPLIQSDLKKLIFCLTESKYLISIETNGTIKIPIDILYLANWVMDIKLPSSGCSQHILEMDYYENLPKNVYFKFCISDVKDYEIAKEMSHSLHLTGKTIAFSPIIGTNKDWPKMLAEKIVSDRLPYIYNLQIHKYLNVK